MRRKNEDEVQEGAAWLATYSDMVTLLFVFFVLMFAISSVNEEKFAYFVAAMQPGGLTEEKMFEIQQIYKPDLPATDVIPPIIPEDTTETPTQPNQGDGDDNLSQNPDGSPAADEDNRSELGALYDKFLVFVDEYDLGTLVFLHEGVIDGDTIRVTLADDMWFKSGSAEISPGMATTAKEFAKLLGEAFYPENPFEVIISGHTDNVPQSGPIYADNWDLSYARAGNFMKLLTMESGIPQYYFNSRAYGDQHPIASNDTAEGRQKNRRIELSIAYVNPRYPNEIAEESGD